MTSLWRETSRATSSLVREFERVLVRDSNAFSFAIPTRYREAQASARTVPTCLGSQGFGWSQTEASPGRTASLGLSSWNGTSRATSSLVRPHTCGVRTPAASTIRSSAARCRKPTAGLHELFIGGFSVGCPQHIARRGAPGPSKTSRADLKSRSYAGGPLRMPVGLGARVGERCGSLGAGRGAASSVMHVMVLCLAGGLA